MTIKVKHCLHGSDNDCRFTADIGDVVLLKEETGKYFEARIRNIISPEQINVTSLVDESDSIIKEADIEALMLGD